jgi:IS30 family transposase
MKTLDMCKQFSFVYRELQRIAKSLHKIYENECSYGHTDRQDKRKDKLQAQAENLAARVELKVYHQTDPRGCSMYLIDESCKDYTDGIAVY